MLREQDRHFLWSLYTAVTIIFIWKGVWDAVYEIPYIGNPWTALFIGGVMLIFSGMVFQEFDPFGGMSRTVTKILKYIHSHPHKRDFIIKYFDKHRQKECLINAADVHKVEKNMLVIADRERHQERFIPFHRLTEIRYKGAPYWRM